MPAPSPITVVIKHCNQQKTQTYEGSITAGQLKEYDEDYSNSTGTVIYAMDELMHDIMEDSDQISAHGERDGNTFVVYKAIIMDIDVGIANGDDVDNVSSYLPYDVWNVNGWFETLGICSDFKLEYKSSTVWERISDKRSFLDIGIANGSTIRYHIL